MIGRIVRRKGMLASLLTVATMGLSVTFVSSGITGAQAAPDDSVSGNDTQNNQQVVPEKGSLTIHKIEAGTPTSQNLKHDGSQLTDVDLAGAKYLEGVEFTLQRVEATKASQAVAEPELRNLAGSLVHTQQGQTDAVSIKGEDRSYTFTLSGKKQLTTDKDGKAYFGELKAGTYLVKETAKGPHKISKMSSPFFVTIPLWNKDANSGKGGYLTDVHVYPKNSISDVVKVIELGKAAVQNDKFDWDIKVPVPQLAQGEKLKNFSITDELDGRLTYASAKVELVENGEAITLDEADYTITAPAATKGGTLKVDFTTSGLTKLDAHASATVKVTVTTTFNGIGDGVLRNGVKVNFNDHEVEVPNNPPTPPGENPPPGENTPPRPPDVETPYTYVGILRILKVDGLDANKSLQGAKFDVYAGDGSKVDGASPIATIETDKEGKAGLLVHLDKDASRVFTLVETAAPTGYALDTTKHEITVKIGETTEANPFRNIKNNPLNPPELPLTGSNGALLMSLGGVALLLLAGGVALQRRRQGVNNS